MIPAIIWIVLAIIGLYTCFVNLTEAHADRIAVDEAKVNGARHLLSRATLQAETIRVVVQAIFLVIGLVAVVPGFVDVGVIRVVIQVGLILASGLMVVQSALSIVTRRRLRAYLEQHDYDLMRRTDQDV